MPNDGNPVLSIRLPQWAMEALQELSGSDDVKKGVKGGRAAEARRMVLGELGKHPQWKKQAKQALAE